MATKASSDEPTEHPAEYAVEPDPPAEPAAELPAVLPAVLPARRAAERPPLPADPAPPPTDAAPFRRGDRRLTAVRDLLERAGQAESLILDLHANEERLHEAVRTAYQASHTAAVRGRLRAIPIERLKDVPGSRLPVGKLEQAGYTTVLDLIDADEERLRQIPGIGAKGAERTIAAARRLAESAQHDTQVTADFDLTDDNTTALLAALNRARAGDRALEKVREPAHRIGGALAGLAAAARPLSSRVRRIVTRRSRKEDAHSAVAELAGLLEEPKTVRDLERIEAANRRLQTPAPRPATVRRDFEQHSADYFSTLSRIAGRRADAEAARGFLPASLADRIAAQRLDETCLKVSLRNYQAFGARFALAQERVILGDEMGCGKTVEAIAAMAHLRARGATHFLVIAPASVMINWTREVAAHSTLRAYRLHGADMASVTQSWAKNGGVGVTTFEALRGLIPPPPRLTVEMMVVDEAHYVKNPDTMRSTAVRAWTDKVDRVLFLTGTPMENKVEEFRNLVGYLQPDLVDSVDEIDAVAGSEAFRRAVAPAYLRRNQEDVLSELPDLIQVDEWEEFGAEEADIYREAVASRNFMMMRRAAYATGSPDSSAKLKRLVEIADEAGECGLKVVVFSYFRDVLDLVCETLGDRATGPLTGAVPPAARQEMVDGFSKTKGHAVLVSQIQAGGVGLNMQAASVVILCEPQVKPTLETQAIARAHRMGQIRRVQVHRLLVTDSVDQRMLEILEAKQGLFDAFARRSETAESIPGALDLSSTTLGRQVIAAERERLGIPDRAVSAAK
ncbi:MAG TPA: SNF2-related protein [Actinocrinis sp.]|nr:SNF2-related protein [Actinocrinis sp.]